MKRIESIYFSAPGDTRYSRMARVLEHTARLHCPDYLVNITDVSSPRTDTGRYRMRSFATNSDKLDHWAAIVMTAGDGDCVALLDADMMIVSSIDSIWSQSFDVAITGNRPVRMPYNGGAVFVRASDDTRMFMTAWAEVNQRMYHDALFHAPFRAKYGGINQASLGYMIDELGHKPLVVDCAEWNGCDEKHWARWRDCRIVHIKSGLRRALFAPGSNRHTDFIRHWRKQEEAANATQQAMA